MNTARRFAFRVMLQWVQCKIFHSNHYTSVCSTCNSHQLNGFNDLAFRYIIQRIDIWHKNLRNELPCDWNPIIINFEGQGFYLPFDSRASWEKAAGLISMSNSAHLWHLSTMVRVTLCPPARQLARKLPLNTAKYLYSSATKWIVVWISSIGFRIE